MREAGRGQALVEFALIVIVFIVMLMGIFDLGRVRGQIRRERAESHA